MLPAHNGVIVSKYLKLLIQSEIPSWHDTTLSTSYIKLEMPSYFILSHNITLDLIFLHKVLTDGTLCRLVYLQKNPDINWLFTVYCSSLTGALHVLC